MEYFTRALTKYAEFSGRDTRKQYWMFVLFNIIFSICAGILDTILRTNWAMGRSGLFGALYSLALIVPGLAAATRRLHDTGKSGWFILLALIPLVGWIILIILLAGDSESSENKYGPKPVEIVATKPQ